MNQGQNGGNASQEDSMVQEVSMDEKKKSELANGCLYYVKDGQKKIERK